MSLRVVPTKVSGVSFSNYIPVGYWVKVWVKWDSEGWREGEHYFSGISGSSREVAEAVQPPKALLVGGVRSWAGPRHYPPADQWLLFGVVRQRAGRLLHWESPMPVFSLRSSCWLLVMCLLHRAEHWDPSACESPVSRAFSVPVSCEACILGFCSPVSSKEMC